MSSTQSHPELNEQQAEFYESRLKAKKDQAASEEAAGLITNVWTRIRKNIQSFDESLMLDQAYNDLHRDWVRDFANGWRWCFDSASRVAPEGRRARQRIVLLERV